MTSHFHEQPNSTPVDPSLLGGNVLQDVVLDQTTVGTLREAFEHQTANTWILHADEGSREANATFTSLTLDLMTEISRADPDAIDVDDRTFTSGDRINQLIGRVGANWISPPHRQNASSVDEYNAKKTDYLAALSKQMRGAQPSPERHPDSRSNAFKFRSIANQNLNIIEAAVAAAGSFTLQTSPELAERIEKIVHKEHVDSAHSQAIRTEALKGTIFQSEASDVGVERTDVSADIPFMLDLNTIKPLFSREQTHQAFFSRGRTDADGRRIEGYNAPTIASLLIDGQNYAILDTSDAAQSWPGTGRITKTESRSYSGGNEAGQLKVLQVIGSHEDPRYGIEVKETDYTFDAKFSTGVRELVDATKVDDRGYRTPEAGTGVTLKIDKKGRLVIRTDKDISMYAAERSLMTPWAEALSQSEVFDYQVAAVRKNLNGSMVNGRSSYPWASDLLNELNQTLEALAEADKGTPSAEITILTSVDLLNPHTWRNQHGEMDAVNAFLRNNGAGNRDYTLAVIQDEIHKRPNKSDPDATREGSVMFATNTPGVRTEIKYGFSTSGEITYIQPALRIDPTVEIMA